MAASLYGGDTSAHLCNQIIPAVVADRSGDYTRCFSALGLQRLYTCARIAFEPVDAQWLKAEVSAPNPDVLALGLVFALVRPAGEVLPCRAETRPGSGEFVIRLGPLHSPVRGLATRWTSLRHVDRYPRSCAPGGMCPSADSRDCDHFACRPDDW
jgi:hypothetical protein